MIFCALPTCRKPVFSSYLAKLFLFFQIIPMELNTLARHVKEVFEEKHSGAPLLYSSPGRINLIGEHTDYNEGFVLPAAIDKAVYLAVKPAAGNTGTWTSVDFKETIEVDITQDSKLPQHWANYPLGVIQQFRLDGHSIPALDLVVAADIPIGAGMSSSAALECVTAGALNEIVAGGYTLEELALLTQRAENIFIGLRCGVMDMFASLHGKKDHAIKLDCRDLSYEYYPLALEGHVFLLLDTGVKHSLASSEYNTRRLECEKGVSVLQKHFAGINSLRDVNAGQLESVRQELDEIVYRRCKYVIDENERVLKACKALSSGSLSELGKLMYASHNGLQKEYEVSCEELDFLVKQTRNFEGVLGSRMMGGGFGGCTINLVNKKIIPQLVESIAPAYKDFSGITLKHYEVVTGEGTRKLTL